MSQFFISPQNISELFKQFQYILKNRYGEDFIGFDYGMPNDWEAYKPIVAQIAYNILDVGKWSNDDIGTGKILNAIIAALSIKDPKSGKTHNLVNWRAPRNLATTVKKRRNLFEFEKIAFEFYNNNLKSKDAFDQFAAVIGKRYPEIAFLFYIKDSYSYLPLAPTFFDPVFEILGLDFRTQGNASWDNYVTYLGIIQQIQNYLKNEGYPETRLIDAHSFCWMVSNFLQDTETKNVLIKQKIQKRKNSQFQWLTDLSPDIFPEISTSSKTSRQNSDEDYLTQHKQNMAIGKKAEEVVFEYEKERLLKYGRIDLANKIEWTSLSDDNCGYDIKSFNEQGEDIYIEVKAGRTTKGGISFILSNREYLKSQNTQNFFFYCVIFREQQNLIWGIDSKKINEEFLYPLNFLVPIKKQ